ncbi:uncharacterized [Tachysurus ichikawai]
MHQEINQMFCCNSILRSVYGVCGVELHMFSSSCLSQVLSGSFRSRGKQLLEERRLPEKGHFPAASAPRITLQECVETVHRSGEARGQATADLSCVTSRAH